MKHSFLAALLSCLVMMGCAMTPAVDDARRALAPSGKLRVALFEGNPTHAAKRSSGETVGVAHDVGRKLAERLGVPFEPVPYAGLAKLLEGGKAGEWDVAFLGVSAERRAFLDFTGDYIAVEIGYLVPDGAPLRSIEEVDRPGIRVAVVDRGSPQALLQPLLRKASLVAAQTPGQAADLVSSRRADVLAGQKPMVHGVAARMKGSRVLDGSPVSETAALALPRGRDAAAMAYAARFIDDAKADGTIRAAIDRAELRGVVVAER
jgi:polar amino acid transport system substrate-binding protein